MDDQSGVVAATVGGNSIKENLQKTRHSTNKATCRHIPLPAQYTTDIFHINP